MKQFLIAFATVLFASLSLAAQLIPGPAAADSRWPVVGDVNGDGLDDVVDDNMVQLNSGGALLAPVRLAIPGGVLDLLDVNGDHVADLLVSPTGQNGSPQPPFTVWINDGHGNFAPGIEVPYGKGDLPVVSPPLIGDFNGDGKDDLITGYPSVVPGGYDYTFYLSHGDGTFEKRGVATVPDGSIDPRNMRQHVTLGDLNGDGHPDFVVRTDEGLSVFPGHGDGVFEPAISLYLPMAMYGGSGMQIGDVDGDGNADLLFGDHAGILHVFFGDGGGHFIRTAAAPMGDRDGYDDVPRTTALVHYTSAKRFDVVVGANPGLVVTLTYAGGALREVARVALVNAPPADHDEINVFGGKFRAQSARDFYAFRGWGWSAMPARLLFADVTPAVTPPSRARLVGRPGIPSTGSTLALHVVESGCMTGDEVWHLQRNGVFATETSVNGGLIQAFFDTDETISYRIAGPGSFLLKGVLARAFDGHYTGSAYVFPAGAGTKCGNNPIRVDAFPVDSRN